MLPALPSPTVGLETLLQTAHAALASAALPAADPRTSEALDVRTFRYYRTLGLVAAPLRYEGTRALFGELHLLQALAIKALQRHGLSLAEVGRRLGREDLASLRSLVGELLSTPTKNKAELLASEARTTTPDRGSPAASASPPSRAAESADSLPLQAGHTLVLDLAPGIRIHADLARAAQVVPQLPQVRHRFEELLQLLVRLAPSSLPTDPSPAGEHP